MRECATHHFACDCREQMMKEICAWVLHEHDELQRFIGGFRHNHCKCDICEKARRLYPELEKRN